MSGIFNTLNTANKGLQANQTALHTASHNISNVNTRGYTRQRVELKADLAYNLGGVGQLGTGVKMDSIVRLVDDYVSRQIRTETSTLQKYTSKSDVINQLETIFNEPSKTGLNFYLGEMFDSWQELSMNPESLNSKTIVVEKSKAMADTINHMAKQINSLKDETVGQIEKNALDFNSIVSKLETLNEQILNIGLTGQVPNDLLDQRDVMLEDLSALSNFKADFDKYGRVSVNISGNNILSYDKNEPKVELSVVTSIVDKGDGTFDVSISQRGDSLKSPIVLNMTADQMGNLEAGSPVFAPKGEVLGVGNIKQAGEFITAGRIQGNKEALEDLEKSLSSLKSFATNMAKAINTVHTAGGTIGDEFFSTALGDDPSVLIKVNDDILKDNSKVISGKTLTSPEGDGSRALAIARLRNTKLNFNSDADFNALYDDGTMSIKDDPAGITTEGAYGNIVINIGISKEYSDNVIANQEVLLGQLDLKRETTSGVSINEEITNVIKFQKSYDANARVIQALTEMLDTLINRMGV